LTNILHILEVSTLTLDEWADTTTWESFDEFSNKTIYFIDNFAINECFHIHNQHIYPLSFQCEHEDDNKIYIHSFVNTELVDTVR
jgi:hypothetical protein